MQERKGEWMIRSPAGVDVPCSRPRGYGYIYKHREMGESTLLYGHMYAEAPSPKRREEGVTSDAQICGSRKEVRSRENGGGEDEEMDKDSGSNTSSGNNGGGGRGATDWRAKGMGV